MDNSETYVKMCEKAEEIQQLAPLELGNWYAYLRSMPGKTWGLSDSAPFIELIGEDYDGDPSYSFTDDIERCWLPRQDQLQEMMGGNACSLIWHIQDWLWHEEIKDVKQFYGVTMEQLWLAFVMKEKYNKLWTGKDWVN